MNLCNIGFWPTIALNVLYIKCNWVSVICSIFVQIVSEPAMFSDYKFKALFSGHGQTLSGMKHGRNQWCYTYRNLNNSTWKLQIEIAKYFGGCIVSYL